MLRCMASSHWGRPGPRTIVSRHGGGRQRRGHDEGLTLVRNRHCATSRPRRPRTRSAVRRRGWSFLREQVRGAACPGSHPRPRSGWTLRGNGPPSAPTPPWAWRDEDPSRSVRTSGPTGLRYDTEGRPRDCEDFDTQQQAQRFLEAALPSVTVELDSDGDGGACEGLPSE